MKIASMLLILLLVPRLVHAIECQSQVSEFLKSKGYGSFERPGLQKVSDGDADVFGTLEKNGFQLRYSKDDLALPKVRIETVNALGSREEEVRSFDGNCRIRKLSRSIDGSRREISAEYCDMLQKSRKAGTGSQAFIEKVKQKMDANFADFAGCFDAGSGMELCNRYEGKFSEMPEAQGAKKSRVVN